MARMGPGLRRGGWHTDNTGALCSEIYTPELFDKVCRPIWPLDEIA